MKVLMADDSTLISGRIIEILRSFGHFGSTRLNTFCTDNTEAKTKPDFSIDTMKMTGSDGIEVLKAKTKMKRKVIFYRFGFFTLRVIPRSGYINLRRLFFL